MVLMIQVDSFPELRCLLDNIIKMQLVMINTNSQDDNQITPAEQRIVQINIPYHILVLAFVETANIGVKVS